MVRVGAALALPFLVPLVITLVLWALPGDPASIICPPALCTGAEELAQRWGLDKGPWSFYLNWMSAAFQGDFGNSWRVRQGLPVGEMIAESLPTTGALVGLATVPLLVGGLLASMGRLPRQFDDLAQVVGLVPSVVYALLAAAYVQINHGAMSYDGWPGTLRILLGALVLSLADGALAAATIGTRGTFEEERKQRYVQIAVLRGESLLGNMAPNVLPALVSQLRARALHLLSGSVVVEVVLQISGLGELLWLGTFQQDFGLVLAAAWAFSLLAGLLLFAQGLLEVFVALWVRRAPALPGGR
jgi:ABC-type dipeptide/oligopeptide/nickel transport system permease component